MFGALGDWFQTMLSFAEGLTEGHVSHREAALPIAMSALNTGH